MANKKEGSTHRHLRTLFNIGAIATLTDGQLLEKFATGGGELAQLAFAALVERHGSFVLGVCRAILGDEHDAHDAFQATFLALARKAGSLWTRNSIGPWLHQAAYRAACHGRSARTRRRVRERTAASMRSEQVESDDRWEGVEGIIHEEIDRLPTLHQRAVVLCDLEGQTYEQAARQLGCRVGTLKSRLARGREKLRMRLARRGISPARSVVWAALPAVPPSLAEGLVRYATCPTVTVGMVPAAIADLTRGLLMSMLMGKLKVAALGAVVMGAMTAGMVVLGQDRSDSVLRDGPGGDRSGEVLRDDPLGDHGSGGGVGNGGHGAMPPGMIVPGQDRSDSVPAAPIAAPAERPTVITQFPDLFTALAAPIAAPAERPTTITYEILAVRDGEKPRVVSVVKITDGATKVVETPDAWIEIRPKDRPGTELKPADSPARADSSAAPSLGPVAGTSSAHAPATPSSGVLPILPEVPGSAPATPHQNPFELAPGMPPITTGPTGFSPGAHPPGPQEATATSDTTRRLDQLEKKLDMILESLKASQSRLPQTGVDFLPSREEPSGTRPR